jgi:hypothetical protein
MKPATWMKETKRTYRGFSKELGINQSTLWRIIEGVIWPSRDTAMKFVEVSKGAITMNDSYDVPHKYRNAA